MGSHPESQNMELRVEEIRKDFPWGGGTLSVLKGVSLSLSAGRTMAIVGPSGAGKSTLLNIIGSLEKPTSGRVTLGEDEVTSLSGARLAALRARKLGFVFQEHHLLPQCTALENVMLATLAAGGGGEAAARAESLLERVGLGERKDSFPWQLSGGERQRVAIARALVNGPSLLLCDEPTGNLDQATAERIAELFAELAAEKGAMLIVVTHNMTLAARFERREELREGLLRGVR